MIGILSFVIFIGPKFALKTKLDRHSMCEIACKFLISVVVYFYTF